MVKIVTIHLVILLFPLLAAAQSVDTTFAYTGTVQTCIVPACATSATIVASGGQGGNFYLFSRTGGGAGATVTATVSVVPGHTLNVVVGNCGDCVGGGPTTDNNGGGGGSFVWDASSTNYPLVVAGGGGAAGFDFYTGGKGSTDTNATVDGNSQNGAGGIAGGAGAAGSVGSVLGPGGGGGGWNTITGNPAIAGVNAGAGGVGKPAALPFSGGAGRTLVAANIISKGAYGGGGGGGLNTATTYGGGGGGGGYNGGGGGNAVSAGNYYGGGGGGSGYYSGPYPYTTHANFLPPANVTQTNTGVGSVEIIFNCAGDTTIFYSGTMVSWKVPACATAINVTASGGSGGYNILDSGGNGAVVRATVNVVAGHTLKIVVGGQGGIQAGNYSATCSGDPGGGGSFVWDASSTNYPLVVAGGGGGAGGQNGNGRPGSLTILPNNNVNTGPAGSGGQASSLASTTAYGGSGAGWNTATGVPAASTSYIGAGGLGEPGGFAGGSGSNGCSGLPNGAFGGGGGGGQDNATPSDFGGGGGGGGYNGGGGGNGVINVNSACYGGGGGGSGYYNGAYPYTNVLNFVNPLSVTQTNKGKGRVTIASNCPSPLPIVLLSFTAVYDNNENLVKLNWASASEINNALYTVQRSKDGRNFTDVTSVTGAGNSSETKYYSALDPEILGGTVYYRLKQTDYDGQYTYSAINAVSEEGTGKDVVIMPNPATSNINMVYETNESGETDIITMYDCAGRQVETKTVTAEKGVNTFNLDILTLTRGVYIIRLDTPAKTFYKKCIKQ